MDFGTDVEDSLEERMGYFFFIIPRKQSRQP